MDGWNISFILGWPLIFSGKMLVSGRVILSISKDISYPRDVGVSIFAKLHTGPCWLAVGGSSFGCLGWLLNSHWADTWLMLMNEYNLPTGKLIFSQQENGPNIDIFSRDIWAKDCSRPHYRKSRWKGSGYGNAFQIDLTQVCQYWSVP